MIDKVRGLLKSKVLKNSMWLFVLQVFNTVVPLLTLPYITRVLGTSNYGVFSLALNWVTYFQVIVEYGFGFTGARKVSISSDLDLQKLYSRIITARLLLLALSYILMNGISFATHASIEQYISMNILFLVILGVAFQLTWLFQGKQDMKVITIINAGSRVLSVVMIFLIVKKPEHLYLYCVCYSITFVFSAIIGLIYANRKLGLKVRLCKIGDAIDEIKDGWYLFISQAMSKIFSGIGTTVLGIVETSSIVGIYSAVYKMPYILILFFNPISQALYPHISVKFANSFSEGEKAVKNCSKYVIMVFAVVGVCIVIFKDLVIRIAFGEEYLGYSVIIIPLTIWMVLSIINNFLGIQYLVASDNQKIYSQAFSKSMIITVAANVGLGLLFGIHGVAIAAPLGELSLTLLLIYSIKKKVKRGNKTDLMEVYS